MKILGERLKERRLELGYTQQYVADKLKIHHATYHGYESGKHSPDAEMIVKLADLFMTSSDYLLGRYGHTIRQEVG